MRTPLSIGIAILASVVLGLATAAAQDGQLAAAPDGAPISITNAPGDVALVRDVDAPAAQPFRVEVVPSFSLGNPTASFEVLAAVPAGKRLVVTHVSARLFEVPGSSFYLSIAEQVTGVVQKNCWLPGREIGMASSSSSVFMVSESTSLVFESGSRVAGQAFRGSVGSMPARGLGVTVSGYFVDTVVD